MNIEKYLELEQPTAYKLFLNEKKNEYFSHAYLIVGDSSEPVLDIAKYLAKQIICQKEVDSPCATCLICQKIDNNDYLSLAIIDGETETISKNQIQELEDRFSRSSMDKNQFMIYIINIAEHMTVDAVNSILKFIEEPEENVIGILTTRNIQKILPTIISRSQVIKLLPSNLKTKTVELIDEGLDVNYAGILSYFANDSIHAKAIMEDKKLWKIFINAEYYLASFGESKAKANYFLEKEVLPIVTDKDSARKFIDIISIYLSESVKYRFLKDTVLKSNEIMLENIYNNIANIDAALLELYSARSEIELNVNTSLLLEHINTLLTKEKI
ncbi:MAG: hypothetical protein RSE56_02570 [Bacilli bacterium]